MYDDGTFWVVFTIVALIAYMLPAIVGFARGHPNRWVIFALNLCLGGTGIVWLSCLIWAMMAVHRTDDPNGSHGGESGLNVFANDVVRVRMEPPPLPPSAGPPQLHQQTSSPWSPASPPRGDVIDRLERLKKLRDDDVIDQEQFGRMRDAISREI